MASTAIALLALMAVVLAAAAQAHSPQDEAACRPDVFRLCSQAIPDERRIVACLQHNKRYLNSACYRVFDRDPPAGTSRSGKNTRPTQWGR